MTKFTLYFVFRGKRVRYHFPFDSRDKAEAKCDAIEKLGMRAWVEVDADVIVTDPTELCCSESPS